MGRKAHASGRPDERSTDGHGVPSLVRRLS